MTDGDAVRFGNFEVGIVVKDLDASAAFYRDALGLEYIGDLDLPGGTMQRFAHGDAVVKLVLFEQAPHHDNPPGGAGAGATGLRYLTLRIGDVERRVQRCVAAGHAVPVSTFEYLPGVRIAIVEDPEGNWVELVQDDRGER
jgi:catechol 2,3-dioxygenase-like lactoylglutathione lyase family enzyme